MRSQLAAAITHRAAPLALALAVLLPQAADALECGQVLTKNTLLEADLHCPEGDGLIVGADGIVIDLGGHLLSGAADIDNPSRGIGIVNEGYDRVEIHGGRIHGFTPGVHLKEAGDNWVHDLEVRSTTLGGTRQCAPLRGECLLGGITLLDSDHNRIENNDSGGITDDDMRGISLFRSHHNVLRGNHVRFVFNGIELRDSHHNRIEGTTNRGCWQDIIDLRRSDYNRVLANRVGGGDGSSIHLDDAGHNLVAGNELDGTEVWGIYVTGSARNRIEWNVLSSCALRVSGDHNRISRNTVEAERGETGLIIGGRGNHIAHNHVSDSRSGIRVSESGRDTFIHGNHTSGNREDGIRVEDATARIVNNTSIDNGQYGILAVPGVKGGGNRASGNGAAEQCVEVRCRR